MYEELKDEMLNQYKTTRQAMHVHIKVTLRRVRVKTVAVEEQYSVCSLNHPA